MNSWAKEAIGPEIAAREGLLLTFKFARRPGYSAEYDSLRLEFDR
jgi:hypothetical protein